MAIGDYQRFLDERDIEMDIIEVDDIVYRIDDKGYAYAKYADKNVEKVILPGKVDGHIVRGIDSDAFANCEKLKHLEIEVDDAITDPLDDHDIYNSYEIGSGAFYRCRALETVEMPYDGICSIWQCAFSGCESLESLALPDGVFVGSYAFSGCKNLKTIGIKLTVIMEGTFMECYSLTDFPVSPRATEIDEDAFYHCTSLRNIVIPKTVTLIEPQAFRGAELETVVFEDTSGWKGKGTFINRSGSIDVSDPARNAKMLSGMDFDDGFIMFKKIKE